MKNHSYLYTITWLTVFGIAMAYVESAVVVYLRAIFHPEGFSFPLKPMKDYKLVVEVFREAATILMLLSIAFLAGRNRWERFACFMFSFAVWDIFYYIWLKVLINWPLSLLDWDILFLIPLPWIGPVIAPVSISVLMIFFSIFILRLYYMGYEFKPPALSKAIALVGISAVIYSFMDDTDATLHQQMPEPYKYELLVSGDLLFVAAFAFAYLNSVRKT